jgi:hypothetical protein
MVAGAIYRGSEALALAAAAICLTGATTTPDYHQAYVYALKCTVVANSAKDEDGAHRAFDAAMRLGHLQNLSNRQLNEDLDQWGASELVQMRVNPDYKAQMLAVCRKLGFAS